MFVDPNDPDPGNWQEPYQRHGGRGVRYTPVPDASDGSLVDDQATDDLTRHARTVRQRRNDG